MPPTGRLPHSRRYRAPGKAKNSETPPLIFPDCCFMDPNPLIYQRNKISLRNIKYADKVKITARIACLMNHTRYESYAKTLPRHHAPAPYPRRNGSQTQAQLMRAMSRDKEREPLGAHLPWQRPGYRSPRLPAAWWWSFTTRRGHRRQLLLLDP